MSLPSHWYLTFWARKRRKSGTSRAFVVLGVLTLTNEKLSDPKFPRSVASQPLHVDSHETQDGSDHPRGEKAAHDAATREE